MTNNSVRPIHEIAREISSDWKKPYFGAVPYIHAMRQLNKPQDQYGMESAKDIVTYFLANATTWRGETARRIKKELKELCDQ